MKLDVDFEEVLPHPIDAVWRELTRGEAISDWLMATSDYEAEVGSRFRMKTERLSTTGYVEAEVLEVIPPRRLVWSWSMGDGNRPSVVSFDLEPHGQGTRLRLRHEGELDPTVAEILRDGWPGRIEALAQGLSGGDDG